MKAVIAIIAVIVIVGGGAYALVKHNDKKTSTPYASTTSSSTKPSSSTNSSSSSSSSSSTPASSTNSVDISNYAFSPSSITVKKGTTVTWTNKDAVAHHLAETDGKNGPASQDLNQGQTYSFTFDTTGTFKYHCAIHPSMTGTVTVTD